MFTFVGGIILGAGFEHAWQKLLFGATFMAYLAFCAFSICHEASHGLIVRRPQRFRWVNDVIGWTTGVVFLAGYPAFRDAHLEHHRHTNHPDNDPNFWTVAHRDWKMILPIIFALFYIRRQTYLLSKRTGKPFLRASFFIMLALAAPPMLATAYFLSPFDVFALWLFPAFVSSWYATAFIGIMPHGKSQAAPAPQDMEIKIYAPAVQTPLSIFMNCHNYHLLHHAYPNAPFYKYPEIARALMAEKGNARTTSRTYPLAAE
jgi:fatty acid desaturase